MESNVILWIFVLFLCLSFKDTTAINPSGPNVCSYRVSRTYSYNVRVAYRAYESYRTCCAHWGFCWNPCTKYRLTTKYRYETRYSVTYTTYYRCCSGWRQSGYGCQTAICNSPLCVHGSCVRPNTCSCNHGYETPATGCNRDINECLTSNGGCDQQCNNYNGGHSCSCRRGYSLVNGRRCVDNDECSTSSQICRCDDAANNPGCNATCLNTIGSFRCQCSRGYHLVGSGRCVDTNECMHHNGGCLHLCSNAPGSFRCSCHTGYQLESDGKNCSDINECLTSNGGCEHNCINSVGSFHCQCRPGHVLDYNGRTCSDVNECLDHPHGCQHTCNNYKGGYFCSCRAGYRLNGDNKTCTDIDECNDVQPGTNSTLSACTQNCHNIIGSYTCSCNNGYALASDGKTCNDRDECRTGANGCQQTCMNTLGSYVCRCLRGYRLNADGRTCNAMPCIRHPPVINGRGTCFFGKTNETCSFSCHPGFDFRGSKMRRCQANHTWDGSLPTCSRKHCETLSSPINGGISLPCFSYYQATCSIQCNSGYYATGPTERSCRASENSTMYWSNAATTCEEISICAPNPCKHKGVCLAKNKDQFECDCHNTGYQGRKCEEGIVTLPGFSIIEFGIVYTFTIKARPDNDLTVQITTNDKTLIVNPSTIRFNSSITVAKIELRLVSNSTDIKVLSFTLGGTDANVFKTPKDHVLYTKSSQLLFSNREVINNEGALPKGCHNKKIQANDKEIGNTGLPVYSTAPWKDAMGKESTDGIILMDVKGTSLPASLVGSSIISNTLVNSEMGDFIYRHKNDSIPQRNESAAEGLGRCISEKPSAKYLPEVVEVNAFSKTVTDGINRNTPSWITFNSEKTVKIFDTQDFEAKLLKGKDVKQLHPRCGEVLKGIEEFQQYYFYTTNQNMSMLVNDEDIDIGPKAQICILKSVGNNETFIGFANAPKFLKSLAWSTGWSIKTNGVKFTNRMDVPLYRIYGEFSTELESNDAEMKISLIGDMEISTSNDNEFSTDGISTTKSVFATGKISIRMASNLTGDPENSTFIGKGALNTTISGEDSTHRQISISFNHTEVGSTSHLIYGNVQLDKNGKLTYKISVRDSGGQIKGIQNVTQSYNIYNEMQLIKRKTKIPLEEISSQHPELSSFTSSIVSNLDKAELKARDVSTFTNQSMGSSVLQPLFVLKNLINTIGRQLQVLSLKHQQKNSSKIEMNYINEYEKSANQLKQSWNAPLERVNTSRQIISRSITAEGTICFEKLCFGKSSLEIIFDMRSTTLKERFGVKVKEEASKAIIGKINKEMALGGLVTIPKDGVVLQVISNNGIKQGFFNASLNFYGNTFTSTVRYTSGRLEFSTTIFLPDGSKSSIEAQSDITKVLNENEIVFKVKGTTTNETRLIMNINSFLHDKLLKVSKEIEMRMTILQTAVNISEQQFDAAKENLIEKKDSFAIKVRDLHNIENEISRLKNGFVYYKARVISRIKQYDNAIINYTRAIQQCPPKVCLNKCTPGLIAGICYEERYEHVITQKCDLVDKTYTQTEVKSVASKRQYVTYNEHYDCKTKCPPLTGFFKSLFGKRRRRELLEELDRRSLVRHKRGIISLIVKKVAEKVLKVGGEKLFGYLGGEAGSLGAKIGSYLPGPFGIVGMFVGGIIGSAFGKCDKLCHTTLVPKLKDYIHYETLKELKTLKYKESVCSDIPVRQKLGYKHGHECSRWSNCSETLTDVECVLHNQQCSLIRLMLKAKIKTEAHLGPDYDAYERTSLQLEAFEIKKRKLIREKSNANKSLLAAQAIALKANYTHTISKKAIANANKILSTEIKIANLVQSMGKDAVSARYGKFNYRHSKGLSAPNVLYLSIDIDSKDGKLYQTNSLYDFNNANLSITDAVREITRVVGSQKISRKRRAAEEISKTESVTTVADISKNITIQKCQEIEKNVLYLMEVANTVITGVSQYQKMQQALIDAKTVEDNHTRSTMDLIQNNNLCSGEVGCKNNWLTGLYSNVTGADNSTVNTTASWASKRADIFANIEQFTDHHNFTKCSGSMDCVDLAIKSMYDSIEYDNSNASQIARRHMSEWQPFFAQLFNNLTLNDNQTLALANKILMSIQLSMIRNVFCGDAPVILKDLPSVLVVTSKVKATLSITIDSTVHEVRFKWLKGGEELSFAKSNVLELNDITVLTAGYYNCEIWNKFGKVTSNTVKVVYNEAPKITAHPKDLQKTLKSPNATIYLKCNATGLPSPSIVWLFTPFNDTSKEMALPGNDTLFKMNATSANQSGFYRCNASNSQGSDTSQTARVHVKDAIIAEFSTEVSFVIVLRNQVNDSQNASSNSESFNNTNHTDVATTNGSNQTQLPAYLTENDKNELKQLLMKQMNVTEKRIQKLSYVRHTDNRAVISFEITMKNMDSALASSDDWTQISEDLVMARKGLLILPIWLYHVYNNVSSSLKIGGVQSDVIADTIETAMNDGQCPVGYSLNPNGFICQSCKAGTIYIPAVGCEPCPVGTYQTEQRRLGCIPCKANYTTKATGSVYIGDCIPIEKPTTTRPSTTTKETTSRKPSTTAKEPTTTRPSTTTKETISRKPSTTAKEPTSTKPSTTTKETTSTKPSTTAKETTSIKSSTTAKETTTKPSTTTKATTTTRARTTMRAATTKEATKSTVKNTELLIGLSAPAAIFVIVLLIICTICIVHRKKVVKKEEAREPKSLNAASEEQHTNHGRLNEIGLGDYRTTYKSQLVEYEEGFGDYSTTNVKQAKVFRNPCYVETSFDQFPSRDYEGSCA